MPAVSATVCWTSHQKSDWPSYTRTHWLIASRASLSGWNRSCRSGLWAVVANLCQREICPSSPSSPGDTQKKGRLVTQCDEMWSFVDHKGNKQWIWLALDVDTREIVGVYIGARDEAGAQQLWESFPPVYRQCAMTYTDLWAGYGAVFPNTLRQATGVTASSRNLILFKIIGESHRSHLVFHTSLQCIITCLALPWFFTFYWLEERKKGRMTFSKSLSTHWIASGPVKYQ